MLYIDNIYWHKLFFLFFIFQFFSSITFDKKLKTILSIVSIFDYYMISNTLQKTT